MCRGIRYVRCGAGQLKKRVTPQNSGGSGKFRDLYGELFRTRGIMPDVLARQKPRILFAMFDSLSEAKATLPDVSEMTEYERMFYGL